MKWKHYKVPTAVAAAALMALAAASPASAHIYTGSGWSSMHTIGATQTVKQGDIVGAWQNIVVADGQMAKCGSTGMDGYFGNYTTNGTKNWQGRYGLTKDGVVGQASWNKAYSRLSYTGETFDPAHEYNYVYNGSIFQAWFARRGSDESYLPNAWDFAPLSNPSNSGVYIDHPNITFYRC